MAKQKQPTRRPSYDMLLAGLICELAAADARRRRFLTPQQYRRGEILAARLARRIIPQTADVN